jgi:hypothetical protein
MNMLEVEGMNMVEDQDHPMNHRLGGGGYEYGEYPYVEVGVGIRWRSITTQ